MNKLKLLILVAIIGVLTQSCVQKKSSTNATEGKSNNISTMAGDVAAIKSKEVNFSDIVKASNVSYRLDSSFNGSKLKEVNYLGVLSSGDIVALNGDKSVSIVDYSGNEVANFSVSNSSTPKTLAVDERDNIYLLVPQERSVEQVYRGKKITKTENLYYLCDIYNSKGGKLKSFKIEGVKEASGVKVIGGTLAVADVGSEEIDIFDAATGAHIVTIDGLRTCGGILDLCVKDKKELLVANLGAFRVESYNLKGEELAYFGERGASINNFHGSCNPVNVAHLSNGAIVTIEKTPTRVKVYSKEGATKITGIDDIVKDCSYLPMTVDNRDNIYIASPKGIIRCVREKIIVNN